MLKTKKNQESQVSIKLNRNTKNEANALFNHLGLSMSSAIKMFINKSLIDRGIPFKVQDNDYDPKTQKRVNDDIKNLAQHGNTNVKGHHLITNKSRD